jgi:hypothetical protein
LILWVYIYIFFFFFFVVKVNVKDLSNGLHGYVFATLKPNEIWGDFKLELINKNVEVLSGEITKRIDCVRDTYCNGRLVQDHKIIPNDIKNCLIEATCELCMLIFVVI